MRHLNSWRTSLSRWEVEVEVEVQSHFNLFYTFINQSMGLCVCFSLKLLHCNTVITLLLLITHYLLILALLPFFIHFIHVICHFFLFMPLNSVFYFNICSHIYLFVFLYSNTFSGLLFSESNFMLSMILWKV